MTSSVTTPSGAQNFSSHLVQVLDVRLQWQFLHDPCPCNSTIQGFVQPIVLSSTPASSRTPVKHLSTMTHVFNLADSKRGLATEWQHFAPVQVVLRALVRCAPILANQVSVDNRGHEPDQQKKENTVLRRDLLANSRLLRSTHSLISSSVCLRFTSQRVFQESAQSSLTVATS